MNPVPWLQMTNMISYQGLVRTFHSTDKLLTRGDNASDSVLMSMRILLHRLSKYEGSDGKVGQINKMMHRLGYFKASDVLREAQ